MRRPNSVPPGGPKVNFSPDRDSASPDDYTTGMTDYIPEHSHYRTDEMEALRSLIAASPGAFTLNLAICTDTALRSHLAQELQSAFPAIELVSFWPYTSDLFEHVHRTTAAQPRDALFVSGLEDALDADIDRAALLATLNTSPPRWKAWFACPVIFWMNGPTADLLREEARDFWEWQTGLFRLDA